MKSTLGINIISLNEIATFLNKLLADEYLLYTKTRNAHWNAKGPNFHELHTFFEMQYKVIDVIIDNLAERILTLGHTAKGSLKEFLAQTQLTEAKSHFSHSAQLIQSLLGDHETIIRFIRNDIIPVSEKNNDYGTGDLVTGLLEQHEKMAWMLRAFLTEPDFSATSHLLTVTNNLSDKHVTAK